MWSAQLHCLFSPGPAQSGILSDREVVNLFLHFTVNPKPRVDYIDRPRCCLRGKECSINRFQQVESRWGYSGTSDRIRYWSYIFRGEWSCCHSCWVKPSRTLLLCWQLGSRYGKSELLWKPWPRHPDYNREGCIYQYICSALTKSSLFM